MRGAGAGVVGHLVSLLTSALRCSTRLYLALCSLYVPVRAGGRTLRDRADCRVTQEATSFARPGADLHAASPVAEDNSDGGRHAAEDNRRIWRCRPKKAMRRQWALLMRSSYVRQQAKTSWPFVSGYDGRRSDGVYRHILLFAWALYIINSGANRASPAPSLPLPPS